MMSVAWSGLRFGVCLGLFASNLRGSCISETPQILIVETLGQAERCTCKSSPRPAHPVLSIMKRLLIALAMLCLSGSALSCRVSPKALYRDHAVIVDEASTIVLVEVVPSPATSPNLCQLRTVRTLKGHAPAEVPVSCRVPANGEWMTSFETHKEKDFWQKRRGRILVDSSCTLLQPAFTIGHTYLLLLGIAPDTKQFEEIAGPNDEWLRFVERRLPEGKR